MSLARPERGHSCAAPHGRTGARPSRHLAYQAVIAGTGPAHGDGAHPGVAECGKYDRQDDDQSARVVRALGGRLASVCSQPPPTIRAPTCISRRCLRRSRGLAGEGGSPVGQTAAKRWVLCAFAPPPCAAPDPAGKRGCRLGRARVRPCCAAHEKAGGGSIPSGQVAWTWWFAGCNAEVAATGNSTRNVDPSLSLDSTQMRPPMRLTSSLQM